MRQVPHYLLIGNGRVARHFRHYFSLLNLPFLSWHRNDKAELLQAYLKSATHILLLISDGAIDTFIEQHLSDSSAIKIHFSGNLLSQYAIGMHPLMSFNQSLYELERYQKIPFVIEEGTPDFTQLLPGFANPHAYIKKELKAKYHAYCVLANNFSCMLWQKLMRGLNEDFSLPSNFANAFLEQSTRNLLQDPEAALTGPLVRNDLKTIESNLAALRDDPFKDVYQSFFNAYQAEGG